MKRVNLNVEDAEWLLSCAEYTATRVQSIDPSEGRRLHQRLRHVKERISA